MSHPDPKSIAISFDLKAILYVPHSNDSTLFYKTKLGIFNFTIYVKANGRCTDLKDCEIAMHLLQYLHSLPEETENVTSWSDTYFAQNRNQFLFAAIIYAVNTINHLKKKSR